MNQQIEHTILRGWTICLLVFACRSVSAQQIAVKTNALSDLGAIPNIGVELVVGEKTSIEFGLTGTVTKPWKKELELATGSLQYRHWISQRSLSQLFIGVGGRIGSYTYRDEQYSYYSDLGVAEVFGGYAWPIAKRWNFELYYGIGLLLQQQHKIPMCTPQEVTTEVTMEQTNLKYDLATTSVGINIVYILK